MIFLFKNKKSGDFLKTTLSLSLLMILTACSNSTSDTVAASEPASVVTETVAASEPASVASEAVSASETSSEAVTSTEQQRNDTDSKQETLKNLVTNFGVDGWARCMAAQASISVLIVQQSDIGDGIKTDNNTLGIVLGEMRKYMISNGIPDNTLQKLLKNQGLFTSGDEALKVQNECILKMNSIVGKTQ